MSLVTTAAAVANDLIGDAEAPYVLLYNASRSIGGLIPDVTIREVLSDESTITVHPVEIGTPVSDHVFDNPKLAELTIGYSDATGGFPGYAALRYQAMLALQATREPFDFYTDARLYSNMLIGNITRTADDTTDQAAFLTVRLQQVIISGTDSSAGSLDAASQADPASTASETNVGNQTLQPAPSASLYSDYESGFGPTPGTGGSNI